MTTRPVTYVETRKVETVTHDFGFIEVKTAAGYPRRVAAYLCPVCKCWYTTRRRRKTCSDACRSKRYRRRHREPRFLGDGEAQRKGAATKAAQTHKLNCEVCGRLFRRDGNSAGRTKYCNDACKQEACRRKQRGGDKRTPRNILIADAVLTVKDNPFWDAGDRAQVIEMLDGLAAARNGAVLKYWEQTKVKEGPLSKLIKRIANDTLSSRTQAANDRTHFTAEETQAKLAEMDRRMRGVFTSLGDIESDLQQ